MSTLRETIREILSEELSKLERSSGQNVQEEFVRIESDADLAAFTSKLLRLARDPAMMGKLENGSHMFRLQTRKNQVSAAPGRNTKASPAGVSRGETTEIAKQLITERDITRLTDTTTALSICKSARLTPLATDELRRRGIDILRKQS